MTKLTNEQAEKLGIVMLELFNYSTRGDRHHLGLGHGEKTKQGIGRTVSRIVNEAQQNESVYNEN